jgi:hypothetical protein
MVLDFADLDLAETPEGAVPVSMPKRIEKINIKEN